MKFDGTAWQVIGTQGFTDGLGLYNSLAFDSNGTPYISMEDFGFSFRARVLKFDGTDWVDVGTKGISTAGGGHTSLGFDSDNTPWVVFQDSDNSNKATVKKFDGTNWVAAGSEGFTGSSAGFFSLKFDSNDIPHISFWDVANGQKATVRKFDGTSWVAVGTEGFSDGTAYDTSLHFDSKDIPMVAFQDRENSEKATVMKLGPGPINASAFENQSIALTINSTDIDGDTPLTFGLDGGADSAKFTINSSGVLSFVTPPDFESAADSGENNIYDVIVKVSDPSNAFSTESVTITVIDTNDPPDLSKPSDLTENEDFGSVMVSLVATDPEGDIISFTATSSDTSVVSIGGITGTTLTLNSVLNASGTVTITLVASSPAGQVQPSIQGGNFTVFGQELNTTTQTFTVTVDPVNDAPAITNQPTPGDWEVVGLDGFSDGEVRNTALALDSQNTPYFAYKDQANEKKATVMKFDGTNWVPVGDVGFSDGEIYYTDMVIDSTGTPYVAYLDVANGNKATVMKFDGQSWVVVGSKGFSDSLANYPSIAIDSNDNVYLGYRDWGNGHKATVMKFDGTNWVAVGSKGFSDGQAWGVSLAFDSNDKPYLGYLDKENADKATVMKFESEAWTPVGTKAFNDGAITDASIALDSNDTLYMGFRDLDDSGKANVWKFENGNWLAVGVKGFSDDAAISLTLKIDSNDTLNVFFEDGAIGRRATVMKFENGAWVVVGTKGFSNANAYNSSFEIDSSDRPFAAFQDSANAKKSRVMTLGQGPIATSVFENQSSAMSITSTDIDADTPLTYSLEGGVDNALFTIDPSSGVLSFLNAPNFENPTDNNTDNVYELIVKVSDPGNLSSTEAVQITVINADDAPTLSQADISKSEDFADFSVTINAADEDGDTLIYTVNNLNPELATVVLNGNQLDFTSIANQNGTATIELTATGGTPATNFFVFNGVGGAVTVTDSFQLVIQPVNDLPVPSAPSTLNVTEDIAGSLSFTASDADGDNVGAAVTTNPAKGQTTVNNNQVTYTPTKDLNGSDSFVLTFDDGNGGVVPVTVNVTIAPVDDPPVIVTPFPDLIRAEDSGGLILPFSVEDIDSDTSTAVLSTTQSGDNIITLELVQGRWIVNLNEHANGEVDLTLSASVDGLADSTGFHLRIDPVNDIPFISPVEDVQHEQDTQVQNFTVNLSIWDDIQVASLSALSSNTGLIAHSSLVPTLISSTTASLTYQVEADQTGVAILILTATDNQGATYLESFKVVVRPSDDAICVQDVLNSLKFIDFKGENKSQDYVTMNLLFPSAVPRICAATIGWTSSSTSVMQIQGTTGVVIRDPNDPKTIAVIGTVTKGNFVDRRLFLVTVPPAGESVDAVLQRAYDSLTFDSIRLKNIRRNEIVSNLTLPRIGVAVTDIAWVSSDETIINPFDGSVHRNVISTDTSVVLTASISKGGTPTAPKVFDLTVKALPVDCDTKLGRDHGWLKPQRVLAQNRDPRHVIFDLLKPLPTAGAFGSAIEWTSSRPDVISVEGDVIRSDVFDAFVRLEAKLTCSGKSKTSTFVLKVLKKASQDLVKNKVKVEFEKVEETVSATEKIFKVVVKDSNQQFNTFLKLEKAIEAKTESVITEDTVKNVVELEDKILTVFLNTDGSAEMQSEFVDKDGNQAISKLNIPVAESTSTVSTSGAIETTVAFDGVSSVTALLGETGSVSHVVKTTVTTNPTIAVVNLPGAQVTVEQDQVKTSFEESSTDSNGDQIILQAEVSTDKTGKSVTKFTLKNLTTGETKELDNTVSSGSSFEAGNKVEIIKQSVAGGGEKVFLKIQTPLEGSVVIE
jgi:hypothetical protein